MSEQPLISAADLATHLHDPLWVIVDCRFNLTQPTAGRTAYGRAHIPGARYAHLDEDLSRPPTAEEGRHPLPVPTVFAKRLGTWGISNDSIVVAYDDSSGAIAARLWWMLRWFGHSSALVLDGGLAAWQALGLPTDSDVPQWQPARFVPRRIATEAWAETDAILELQARGNVLVDARAAPRFRGEQEPIDAMAGHVPGARNWPFSNNLGPDGRFRAPSELKRDLEMLLGERRGRDVIAMCGSGVTACHLLLAMAVAGLEPGRLYAGSWSEWIRDPARPTRTGPEP